MGPAVGGIDLVNYGELYHPMSHHNVATGNDKPHVFPTDLYEARNNLEFVNNGFYNPEAVALKNAHPPTDATKKQGL